MCLFIFHNLLSPRAFHGTDCQTVKAEWSYRQLRARRALSQRCSVENSDSALLVLNGTFLNIDTALLALN